MYKLFLSDDFLRELQVLDNKNPGIANKLQALEEDPISIAISTGISAIGEYYVNASNNYAILFDIDEEQRRASLHTVIHKAKLYKIINKIISP